MSPDRRLNRRTMLRRGGGWVAVLATVSLAGCGVIGGDGSDGGGDGGGNANAESLSDPMGEISESSVDGLRIADAESDVDGGQFVITMTLENTGNQTTDVTGYALGANFYNSGGNRVEGSYFRSEYPDGTEVEPGETGTVIFPFEPDGGTDTIARYEIFLTCHQQLDGTYCS